MVNDEKLLESVKFLLKNVKQLNDRFVELRARVTELAEGLRRLQEQELPGRQVSDPSGPLRDQLDRIERELAEYRDGLTLAAGRAAAPPELPVREGTKDRVVPAINLALDRVLDAYMNTPILLEPFSRPCAVSARTLGGETEDVELELFLHGTTWALETLEGGWILVPRPGTLERRVQLQSLERLFLIQEVAELPATLHLVEPASAVSLQYGKSWMLSRQGVLTASPDPLRRGSGQAMAEMERRLSLLEKRVKG